MSEDGRPEAIIDWEIVDKLLSIQCTMKEICGVIGVSHDTLLRRCKDKYNMPFASYSEQKGASGRMSLRRKQFEVAMSGNVTMLIFLGKQLLDQKDKVEETVTHKGEVTLNKVDLQERIQGLLKNSEGEGDKATPEAKTEEA